MGSIGTIANTQMDSFNRKLSLLENQIENRWGTPKQIRQDAYEIQGQALKLNKKGQISNEDYEAIKARVSTIMRL